MSAITRMAILLRAAITGQAIMIDGGLLNIHAHALIETVVAAKGRV
jgi:hypothetical protein